MTSRIRLLILIALLAAAGFGPLAAQRSHTVRLVRSADGEAYRFEPARVEVHAGEVVEFTVESGGPYVIAFEPADLKPGDRDLLASAIGGPGRLRSPVLRGEGDRFRLVVPALPRGAYRFSGALHIAYRMLGQLVVR